MRKVIFAAFVFLSVLSISSARCAESEVVAKGLGFPEGTIFVEDALYFVDYSTSKVLRLGKSGVETVWKQEGCGSNGLVQVSTGLLVACYENGTIVSISFDGRVSDTIRQDDAGRPFHSPNDLAADAKGGVYFTCSGTSSIPGKVYYRGANGHVTEVATGISDANGLAVSLDGKLLYLAESGADRLLTFAIAADGRLGDRHQFLKLGDILRDDPLHRYTPDGVRIDRHGNLFVGLYRGGGFAVFNSNGKLIKKVDLPAPHHANLAISPDGKFVYITAAYDQPDGFQGELMRVDNPVKE